MAQDFRWVYVRGSETSRGKYPRAGAGCGWQWTGGDTSCADDDNVRVERLVVVAGARVHTRDLVGVRESAVLADVAPARRAHRERRIFRDRHWADHRRA